MAIERDDLTRQLPPDTERAEVRGPFLIRRRPGSFSVIVLTTELVTCGGLESRVRASELTSALNKAWNEFFDARKVDRESLE